jgi:hypothetical protein
MCLTDTVEREGINKLIALLQTPTGALRVVARLAYN